MTRGTTPASSIGCVPLRYACDLPGRIGVRDMFSNANPVELDVGSGKGLFLIREATRRPACNFLGVEWAEKYAQLSAQRVARAGLTNVLVVCADIRQLICRLAGDIFAAVHILFPDPWWKRRHRKRRVVSDAFITDVTRVMQRHASLTLVTDVAEYFEVMLRLMQSRSAFQRIDDPHIHLPEDDLDYLTHFERKYRLACRPIYRACYQRVADALRRRDQAADDGHGPIAVEPGRL